MDERILFFKIPIWWRPRVVRELLIELLCTKFNLKLEKHSRTRHYCTLSNDDMMISIKRNMVDVFPSTKETKVADEKYLRHLFYEVGRRKK